MTKPYYTNKRQISQANKAAVQMLKDADASSSRLTVGAFLGNAIRNLKPNQLKQLHESLGEHLRLCDDQQFSL